MTAVAQSPESRVPVRTASEFGRVAVMYGGNSSERAVSLDTGAAVLRALRSRGVYAQTFDPAEESMQDFISAGFDRVWIALHGPGGEDGALQGLLQWLELPYTGSGVLASSLAMDKVRSKHLFRALELPTPDYRVVGDPESARAALAELGLPLILKPSGQGSSVGMSKVIDERELAVALELALSFEGEVLAERCVIGDELTVGVLQGMALPSIRIETPHAFYDYSAKYESERTRYICPGTSSPDQEAQLQELALAAFYSLGCTGWGRVDFMCGADGVPQILEVNTVPGMTSHSLVPMGAKQAGMDFPELCWRILETSFQSQAEVGAIESREVANGT
jgi:D-alanine-D-alanine ligase